VCVADDKFSNNVFLVYFDSFKVLALDLKFDHINYLFQICVQLMKWSLSSLVSPPIWNFEIFLKLNILLHFQFWFFYIRLTKFLIIEWQGNFFCTTMSYIIICDCYTIFRIFKSVLYLIWISLNFSSQNHRNFKFSPKNLKFHDKLGHVTSSLRFFFWNFFVML